MQNNLMLRYRVAWKPQSFFGLPMASLTLKRADQSARGARDCWYLANEGVCFRAAAKPAAVQTAVDGRGF
jgi:hypothetical protein